ncbi:MAG: hypothetical protein RLZZ292_801 [Bacteroidota bacterium]|jgi:cytochrome c peroxidase
MKKMMLFMGLVGTGFLYLTSCQDTTKTLVAKTPKLPDVAYEYAKAMPSDSFKVASDNMPNTNQVTDGGATLGRVLFYDPKLSLNNLVACASCHKQDKAFSDDVALSVGFANQKTSRNSMAIANVRYQKQYFWDQRESKLEEMVLQPVKNHVEMGMENLDNLAAKLAKVDYYPALFEKAYGTPEVTKERLGKAMAQFLHSMVSVNSKYDEGSKQNFANFSQDELAGRELFFQKMNCSACHGGANFNERKDGSKKNVANIGLDKYYTDGGLGARSGGSSDQVGQFKIPTLRNVSLTGPYMHDGRFKTLEEVVDHYSDRVVLHENLDKKMRGVVRLSTGGYANDTTQLDIAQRFNLSVQEKKSLVSFLKTLTDDKYTKDVRFADPFQ